MYYIKDSLSSDNDSMVCSVACRVSRERVRWNDEKEIRGVTFPLLSRTVTAESAEFLCPTFVFQFFTKDSTKYFSDGLAVPCYRRLIIRRSGAHIHSFGVILRKASWGRQRFRSAPSPRRVAIPRRGIPRRPILINFHSMCATTLNTVIESGCMIITYRPIHTREKNQAESESSTGCEDCQKRVCESGVVQTHSRNWVLHRCRQ
jgi:hypothetical protein